MPGAFFRIIDADGHVMEPTSAVTRPNGMLVTLHAPGAAVKEARRVAGLGMRRLGAGYQIFDLQFIPALYTILEEAERSGGERG